MEVTAFFSLGSNLGNREQFLQDAIEEMKQIGVFIACSSIYETPPWGFDTDNSFLNLCANFKTSMTPLQILETTQSIESQLGREKKDYQGYSSRKIDIDLLFYGSQVLDSPALTIPHPHFSKRRFVLQPLNDIASDFVVPNTHLTVSQLLRNCSDNSSVVKVSKGFC